MAIIIESVSILASLIFWGGFIIFSCFNKKNILYLPALAFQLIWIVYRVLETGHAPFAGFYESLVFFSFLYGLKIIYFTGFYQKVKAAALLPVLILLILSLLLPGELKPPVRLVPVLKSFWIYIHVPAFFIGYVSLTIGFILAVYLSLHKTMSQQTMSQDLMLFHNEIKTAFFFITAGIITGGFWAEISWGVFWSWDPKEVCALITWVILASYFHIPSDKWKKISIIFAFISMLFMYFGAAFILPGLHSYTM